MTKTSVFRKITAIFLTLIFAASALADQAAYVTKDEATRAAALLKTRKQIKHYCAPCDDKSVRDENINTIETAATGYENTWEVKVNGEGVDLAYVYFQDKKGKWKNVAKELDIEVDGVPKFLPKDKK